MAVYPFLPFAEVEERSLRAELARSGNLSVDGEPCEAPAPLPALAVDPEIIEHFAEADASDPYCVQLHRREGLKLDPGAIARLTSSVPLEQDFKVAPSCLSRT